VKAAAASAAPLDKARDKLGGRPAKRKGRAKSDVEQAAKLFGAPEAPTEEDK
jgi:hypothetical protein